MSIKLQKEDKAPNFELEANDGNVYSLNSFSDKILILYFYPKDNTSGCTTEAIEFTAKKNEFENLNAEIVGVSPDSVKSHCNFINKHNLGILLLSDPDKKVAEAYGAFGEKKMYGKVTKGIIRSTFVIKNGIVINAYYNVKAKGHAEKVLNDLKGFK
ncbi:peroxiredoxin [Deferribacterales bacterium Es71-Z0220]|uniref:peroxiredoxin n=1 Tax=Deferrivibrio essentukiensis TaxID=2880922 RepID=UPI001F617DA3|nr:peroxiredoxin [Deferrivibrio essentukiensis]MCB4204442.1 peroxiredoxin [Deferrivibrio essentukiensis]